MVGGTHLQPQIGVVALQRAGLRRLEQRFADALATMLRIDGQRIKPRERGPAVEQQHHVAADPAFLLLDQAGGLAARQQVAAVAPRQAAGVRSEEHTSELQSLMRNSSAVVCLKKKTKTQKSNYHCDQSTEKK